MKTPKRSNFFTFAKETPLKVHQDPYENRTRQIVQVKIDLFGARSNCYWIASKTVFEIEELPSIWHCQIDRSWSWCCVRSRRRALFCPLWIGRLCLSLVRVREEINFKKHEIRKPILILRIRILLENKHNFIVSYTKFKVWTIL